MSDKRSRIQDKALCVPGLYEAPLLEQPEDKQCYKKSHDQLMSKKLLKNPCTSFSSGSLIKIQTATKRDLDFVGYSEAGYITAALGFKYLIYGKQYSEQ